MLPNPIPNSNALHLTPPQERSPERSCPSRSGNKKPKTFMLFKPGCRPTRCG